MKPTRPTFRSQSKITSFAQKNAQSYKYRFRKAVDERKKLVKAQYTTKDPVSSFLKSKGEILDRKIKRFRSKIS